MTKWNGLELPESFFHDDDVYIIKGDACQILPQITEKSVDLVLTDPPYGIKVEYGQYTDTEDNWFKLMANVIPLCLSVARMTIMPSCQIRRLKWIYDNFPPDWLLCWYKGSTGHASYLGFNDWEPHLVYGRTKNRLYMHDYFQTKSSPKRGSYGHPCPKPEAWAEWIISRATDESNIIIDPFLGSATTMVVARKLKRKCIGIELEEKYCELSAIRYLRSLNDH